ncbi:MAG TPA: NYN domain-containing protein [Acidimicrobiales bacterium]|nr:NYN domain-containing protein [Acidimicrobiales bacterium]
MGRREAGPTVPGPGRRRWLIDGMNVVGAEPNGWWRDRPRAMAGLTAELVGFQEALGEPVAVVFDGHPPGVPGVGAVEVAGAPGGPDAADDEIARRVAADRHPEELVVVTSDHRLVARVRAAGARVVGATGFRRRLLPAALSDRSAGEE